MAQQNLLAWGFSFDEYQRMFDLKDEDFEKAILDIGGGPASFNEKMHAKGYKVISVDPLYALPEKELQVKVKEVLNESLTYLTDHSGDLVWKTFPSLKDLGMERDSSTQVFLGDFTHGQSEDRYISKTSPEPVLPFDNAQFGLALCPDGIFNSEGATPDLALTKLKELARVAQEVRIYPLVDENGEPSPFLGPVMLALQSQGYGVEVRIVPYEVQKGANAMMRVWPQTCDV